MQGQDLDEGRAATLPAHHRSNQQSQSLQDQIDPELFQKLQEFLTSNNKEQLLQSISEEEFEQLFMLARHLKKSQSTQNDDQMDGEQHQGDEEQEETTMKDIIEQLGLENLRSMNFDESPIKEEQEGR